MRATFLQYSCRLTFVLSLVIIIPLHLSFPVNASYGWHIYLFIYIWEMKWLLAVVVVVVVRGDVIFTIIWHICWMVAIVLQLFTCLHYKIMFLHRNTCFWQQSFDPQNFFNFSILLQLIPKCLDNTHTHTHSSCDQMLQSLGNGFLMW